VRNNPAPSADRPRSAISRGRRAQLARRGFGPAGNVDASNENSTSVLRPVCLLLLAYIFWPGSSAAADAHKQVVGAVEDVVIEALDLHYRARIDTGAQTSSIHAEDIEIDPQGDAVDKPITFRLVDERGESRRVETRVARVLTVRTAEGSERRYAVPLTVRWRDTSKSVLFTLNDRSHMHYRLLLGRNWLHGDFVVDVDINADD
jgi:hypothetical protein